MSACFKYLEFFWDILMKSLVRSSSTCGVLRTVFLDLKLPSDRYVQSILWGCNQHEKEWKGIIGTSTKYLRLRGLRKIKRAQNAAVVDSVDRLR